MSGRSRNLGGSCSCLYDARLEGCVLDKKRYRAILTNNTADTIDDRVDHLLANGVVTTSIVVGRIFLAADQSLGVEELSVVAGTDLINGGRVEIDEERPGDVFAVAGLGEEGVEGTTLSNGGIGIRAAIRSEAVLKEVPGGTMLAGDIAMDTKAVWTCSSQALLPSWAPA